MTAVNQEIVTSHWNNRAKSYRFNISRDFFSRGVNDRWRELVAEAIGPTPPLEVLDAGCGPAVLTRLLLDLGHAVTAVDVSEKMLAIARQNVGPENDRVRFHQASAAKLPFADGTFDLVISRYLVWTLPEPAKAMREWRRLLKPGGRLGIIDGNFYYHYYRSRFRRWLTHLNSLWYKVRSGFDPGQKLATHYARDLPTTRVLRPDWDIGVLTGLGFENIRIFTNLDRRIRDTRPWTLKRLISHWNNLFMVVATKDR